MNRRDVSRKSGDGAASGWVGACRRTPKPGVPERRRRCYFRAEWLLLLLGVVLVPACLPRACALSIMDGPTFTPAKNAPLAGWLRLTTDEPSRVSVTVTEGGRTWDRDFHDFATVHAIPLFGFRPGRISLIMVRVLDRHRQVVEWSKELRFVADPLPETFPEFVLRRSDPARMEPGYTLFRVEIANNRYAYVVIVDARGEVVWYATTPSTADVRQLPNGNLFMPATNRFVELNLLGDEVRSWVAPPGLPINNHDGVPTDHGTILYLSDATETVTNYPTTLVRGSTPLDRATIYYQKVVELDATNSLPFHVWSPVDWLDPRRTAYLIRSDATGWDSEHSNAILEDPSDDSLIVSIRHQHAVVKFDRATGKPRWILGPHEGWGAEWQPYLLTPVGAPFGWQYAQHAPVITPQGTVMLYDNGNDRAMPWDTRVEDPLNYSRAVEYRIDEQAMAVEQVWDYGRTNAELRLYTPWEGSAAPLPNTGNVLITFPAVAYENGNPPSSYGPLATMTRIKEVARDEDAAVVFDLAISMYRRVDYAGKECSVYRAQRIPDLYGHPARPVGDLTVFRRDGVPVLEFSADPVRAYVIESSVDLVDWKEAGTPVHDAENPGNFEFLDTAQPDGADRYYRVVTR